MRNKKIIFLGSGFMAGAIVCGMSKNKTADMKNVYILGSAHPEKAKALADKYGANAAKPEDIADADIVIFAFKPQNFDAALEQYRQYFNEKQLFLSILAGTKCDALERVTQRARVVRTMPNLALSVGLAATGYCLGKNATEEDAEICEAVFAPLGVIRRVGESEISGVTGVSGSGPAYFYYLAEAMAEAAVKDGMDEKTAEMLAVQTLIGAAKLISDAKESPAEMRRRITSKGGTTEAAIRAMTEAGFFSAVEKGYTACKKRSDELGK